MKVRTTIFMMAIGMLGLGVGGCATQGYIQKQMGDIRKQIEENRAEIALLQSSDEEQNEKLTELSETVLDALARVKEMREMAEGNFLYKVTLSDDEFLFAFDSSELSETVKEALDAFALSLKAQNKNCYIEIQGHTDSIGSEAHNFRLGLARARAAMVYLHVKHGIPLNRMNTFSYGKSKPIADNDDPIERAKNRRVTLVVMR